MEHQPTKGTCWYVDLGTEPEHGDVLYKTRPCIIVSDYNRANDCLTIIPIVSRTKKVRLTHTLIDEAGIHGIAKAEQLRTISRSQLRGYKTKIGENTMKQVQQSIAYHMFPGKIKKEKDDKIVISI